MARRQKGGGFLEVTYAILVLVLVAGIILAVLGALGQLGGPLAHHSSAPPVVPGTGQSNLNLPAQQPGTGNLGNFLISSQSTLHPSLKGSGYDGVNLDGSFQQTVDPATIPSDYSFSAIVKAYLTTGSTVTNTISMGSVSNSNPNVSRTSPSIQFINLVPFSSSYPSGPTYTSAQLTGVQITLAIVDSNGKTYTSSGAGVPVPSS